MPPFASSPVFSLSELGISHLGFPGTPFSNILSFRLFVTQALLPGCWFGKCCPDEVSCTHVHLGNWIKFWGQGLGSCLFSQSPTHLAWCLIIEGSGQKNFQKPLCVPMGGFMPFFGGGWFVLFSLSLFFVYWDMIYIQYTSSFLGVHFDVFKQDYVVVSAPP